MSNFDGKQRPNFYNFFTILIFHIGLGLGLGLGQLGVTSVICYLCYLYKKIKVLSITSNLKSQISNLD